jgi:flagellar biosynthesis/type III secretory pathway protein FliH
MTLTPLVLGPAQVPVVTDPTLARRQPELAVLSAMAHGGRAGEKGVFDALLAALEEIDQDHADLYTDIVLAALPEAIRDYLEALMSATAIRARYGYQSDFARRYYAEGEAKGKAEGEAKGEAKAVLAFLDARGIEVPDPVREDIIGCTDLDQLDTWIRRAATATKVQELFD